MAERKIPTVYDKALELNLDRSVYGTFAEIGAGQEVAHFFFRVGAASGTIAKTMSAYDMKFSDEVYGPADRYVSRKRLMQMLDHEYEILIERLGAERGESTAFFAFANTVRARGYQDTGECHGWMGLRFQVAPGSEPQDILLHLRMLDALQVDQQEAIGIVGVNLVYAAFRYPRDLERFTESLVDNLGPSRIEIDLLKFEGGIFAGVDNRLSALQLVQSGLTDAAMFDRTGEVLQPAEQLYKKPILLLRGSFNPVTKVNLDMLASATRRFGTTLDEPDEPFVEIMEMTMRNLLREDGQVDKRDFLRRADSLQALGKTVLISKFARFHRLGAYLSRYTKRPIGIILGVLLLEELFVERWYEDLEGGILESFGRLFKNRLKLYVYPGYGAAASDLRTLDSAFIAPHLRHLFLYLTENRFIEPLVACDNDAIRFNSQDVRRMIDMDDDRWHGFVPDEVIPFYQPSTRQVG